MKGKLFYITVPAQLLIAMFSAPAGKDAFLAEDDESQLARAALNNGYEWIRTDQIDGQSWAILKAGNDVLTR